MAGDLDLLQELTENAICKVGFQLVIEIEHFI